MMDEMQQVVQIPVEVMWTNVTLNVGQLATLVVMLWKGATFIARIDAEMRSINREYSDLIRRIERLENGRYRRPSGGEEK